MTGFTETDYKDNKGTTTGDARGKLFYLLVGGGIGATAALLFAPKPGADLRGNISEVTQAGYDKTVDLSKRLIDKSSNILTSLTGIRNAELGALDTDSVLGKIEDKPPFSGSNGEDKAAKKANKPLNIV